MIPHFSCWIDKTVCVDKKLNCFAAVGQIVGKTNMFIQHPREHNQPHNFVIWNLAIVLQICLDHRLLMTGNLFSYEEQFIAFGFSPNTILKVFIFTWLVTKSDRTRLMDDIIVVFGITEYRCYYTSLDVELPLTGSCLYRFHNQENLTQSGYIV